MTADNNLWNLPFKVKGFFFIKQWIKMQMKLLSIWHFQIEPIMIFGLFVNQLSFWTTWHADKWLHRWVMSALQSVMTTSQQLQLTLSTGWDQTIQENDCFSSQTWPEEIKPEVGLMPAGTVNLLFIFNLLDHLRLFKRSLSRKKS